MMINPNEPRTISSIDLLQERFRQLQKMKELRQQKELLRLLSESADRSPPSSSYTNPPIIIHDKYNYEALMMPTKKLSPIIMFSPPNKPHNNINDCQLSLSLWPDSSQYVIKRPADDRSPGIVGPPSSVVHPKSCFADANAMLKLEGGSDVDTSLRL